jgi:hypothetical protein
MGIEEVYSKSVFKQTPQRISEPYILDCINVSKVVRKSM